MNCLFTTLCRSISVSKQSVYSCGGILASMVANYMQSSTEPARFVKAHHHRAGPPCFLYF